MALSITDLYKIKTKKIGPDEVPLTDTITIAGYAHAQHFIKNLLKETDPGSLADSYKNKMLETASLTKQKNGTTILALEDAFLDLLKNGDEQTMNISIVRNYNQNDWNNQVSNRIAEAMESVAGVLPAEKTAYDGLPN